MARRKRGGRRRVGFSLAELRKLFNQKEAEIQRLQAKREALATSLAEVDAELQGALGEAGAAAADVAPEAPATGVRGRRGRRAPAAAKPGRGRKGKKGKRGPRGDGALPNIIRKVLEAAKEPMKLADIAEKVLAEGYETSSSRFGVIVGQRLSEMDGVKKAGRGMYQLS